MNKSRAILTILVLFVVIQIALIYWLGFIAYVLGMMSLWYIIQLAAGLGIPKILSLLLLSLAAILIPLFVPVISIYYILAAFIVMAYTMVYFANKSLYWHLLLIRNDSLLQVLHWYERHETPEWVWVKAIERLKKSSHEGVFICFIWSYYNNYLLLGNDEIYKFNPTLNKIVWAELPNLDMQMLLDYPLSDWALCRLMLMPEWVDAWIISARNSEKMRHQLELILPHWITGLQTFVETPDEILAPIYKKEGTEQRIDQIIEMSGRELAQFPLLVEQVHHGCSLSYIAIGIAQNMTTE